MARSRPVQSGDHEDRPVLGMALAIIGMFLLPVMDAIAKYIGSAGAMSPGQVTFIRFAVQAVFFGVWVAVFEGVRALWPKQLWINLIRGALIAIASLFFFIAVKYMPLADAIAVFFVEPLILIVLSMIILRETVGWRRVAAVVVGFIGALIVVQPSYALFGPVSLLPLATATLFAFYLLLNRMAGRADSAYAMQFVAGVSGSAVLAIAIVIGSVAGWGDMKASLTAPAFFWWLALAMGMVGMIGHLLIVQAFQRVSASILAPFQYVEIIAAALLGWIVFNEFPTATKWFGIAIIVASGLYVFWREQAIADKK